MPYSAGDSSHRHTYTEPSKSITTNLSVDYRPRDMSTSHNFRLLTIDIFQKPAFLCRLRPTTSNRMFCLHSHTHTKVYQFISLNILKPCISIRYVERHVTEKKINKNNNNKNKRRMQCKKNQHRF